MGKNQTPRTVQSLPEEIFDEFNTEAVLIETTILQLNSIEEEIVLQALHHLDNYASKKISNYEILYEKFIVKPLMPHCESMHLFIRRYANKILCQMFRVPDARIELLQNEICLISAVNNYVQIDDNFLNEYSSIILNHLLENPQFAFALIDNSDFIQTMMKRIPLTVDLDVLWHTLELMKRLNGLTAGLNVISNHEALPFEFIIATVRNEYPIIQNCALDILTQLGETKNEDLIFRFSNPFFLEEMSNALENEYRPDLHEKVIEVIRRGMQHPSAAEVFYKDVFIDRYFDYIEVTTDFKLNAISVLSEVAEYQEAYESLFDHNFTDYLMEFLRESPNYDVARGIKNMTSYVPALERFLQEVVVEPLFRLFNGGENHNWNDRNEAGRALNRLFGASGEACEQALQVNGSDYIMKICHATGEGAIDARFIVIEMLSILSRHSRIRQILTSYDIAHCLSDLFIDSVNYPIVMSNLTACLRQYICEKNLREALIENLFGNVVAQCLKDQELPTAQCAMVDFVAACAKYKELTLHFIEHKVLDRLLKGKDALLHCENWSAAIENILSNYLPMKFALYGHLDMKDVTDEDFYVTKHLWKHPRKLYCVYHTECSPRWPIILCNFKHLIPAADAYIDPRSSSIPIESRCYNRRPYDRNLSDYLNVFISILEENNISVISIKRNKLTVDELKKIIHLLAQFVCTKICSKNDSLDGPCPCVVKPASTIHSNHDNNMERATNGHLDELKHYFHSFIIPLGFIKIGTYFEKSLLFKVLADRIGLPCSLHMESDSNHITWNEVSIPQYGQELNCGNLYPKEYPYNPTHIVDLMYSPGELYAIGCQLALKYQLKPH